MTTTPTPEAFMAQSEPDEPDELLDPPTAAVQEQALPADALDSIASSLGLLVSIVQRRDIQETQADSQRELVDQLDRELAEKTALLDQVLAIVKPSVSKLANQVREAIQGAEAAPAAPIPPAPEPTAVALIPPADDADVEEWAVYAESLGHEVPGHMNRSQIRTMLGIPHPAAEVAS